MLPSGTVTFLFTDIEGSTSRWEADSEGMGAALAEHNLILERIAAEYSGSVFKTIGDAFCVAFRSAEDAAAAALAMQDNLRRAKDPLAVRIALHTGAIQPTGDDYFGTPLNRVARILAAANGGQTLMSEATKALLPQSLPVKDLGTHVLRDLLEPDRIWQLGAGDFGAVRSVSTVRNNLPLQTTSFVGRSEEMGQLTAMLDKSRLITLTGTGGTGKSRLSLQFAADHLERFSDGVWFCELAALPEREDVLRAIVAAVGAPDVIGSMHDRLVMYLAGKRCLLILDNCEHVLDVASKVVEALNLSCASLTIIATSREPLGARGETAFRVPSLPTPDPARRPSLDELDHYGSTALFMDRLATAAPAYQLQPPEAMTIVKICNRLDGIPLAIELAAARGRAMSLEHIEKRLDDRFRLLTGGSRNALSRQQTLRALIDWSVQLLDDKERKFFVSLSVFGGGWNLESAEAVCSFEGSGLESWEIVDLLTALVDKSLVVFERATVRYRMLESVRQYALERLEQETTVFALRDRHADYYCKFAEQFAPERQGHAQVPDYRGFSLDYENFRLAVEWVAGQEGGLKRAMQTLVDSWSGFHSLGRPDEFVRLMEPMLEVAEGEISDEELAYAQLMATVGLVVANNPRGYEKSIAVMGQLNSFEPMIRARWRTIIGYSLFCANRFEDCLEFVLGSIGQDGTSDNPWFAYVYVHAGNSYTALGRYDEAAEAYATAQSEHRKRNDERGFVANLANIVISQICAERFRDALENALDLNRRSTTGTIYISARGPVLLAFGHRALDLGDAALAAALMGGVLGMREDSGVAGDPVDRLGEQSLFQRLVGEMDKGMLDAALERGRRLDWEPWFASLVPISLEQVLADESTIPFAELIQG